MNALAFLILTRLKNTLKSLVRQPVRLIYAVILVALIGFTIFAGNQEESETPQYRDIAELIAGAMALYTLMFLLLARNGFANGGSIFAMPDVNLLFPAPFVQRDVLFYGLLKQVGSSLLLGFFLLFQYTWMHTVYGVSYGFLLILVLGYALAVFFGQFVAMLIYSLTSADERKKKCAKVIYAAYIALLLLYAASFVLKDTANAVQQLVAAAGSPLMLFTPVGGWLGLFAAGAAASDVMKIVLGLGLCGIFAALLILIVEKTNSDFYEDVIKTAEVSQSAINASKQGVVAESAPAHVKLGKTGFGRGAGAEMFYYKHRLENRRSRILILDTISLIWAACVIIFSLFMRESGIIPVFVMATYLQFFSVSLGRFNKELLKPYIYLLPEPPLSKMLHALRESMPSAIVEAVLIFVPVYFIIGMNVPEMLLCILARISFTLLFIAGNVILSRIWSGSASKAVIMLLYMVLMLLLAAPGVILAIVAAAAGLTVFSGIATGFLVITICNLLIALLSLFLCRNMLQYAELNYQ